MDYFKVTWQQEARQKHHIILQLTNQMDRYKENALIKLCEYSLSNKIFEVAELLISNGADVDQTNINGRNAAYYINQRSNEEVPKKSQILDLLKKHSRG